MPGAIRQNLPEGFLLGWTKEKFGKTMKINDFNILTLTIVNTTSYPPKDVMSLKLKKTKSWAYRDSLIEFGK